ncbi:MAG: copper-binding protein [Nitratireductor sp.]
MKKTLSLSAAILLFATMTVSGLAAEYTKGIVKKVDVKANKVTIIHEELKDLDMPAMTMVFRAGNEEILGKLKEGDEIEFIADRVNGKLTVTELK